MTILTNKNLVKHLKDIGVLKSKHIERALLKVDRKDFVPYDLTKYAYYDEALPIGEGQTISQPYTVVFMLELLEPRKGQRILEAGFGSAWQTCLLSNIIETNGHIHSFEIIPEIFNFGENNISKYPNLSKNITTYLQTAEKNIPNVEFDRIIVSANVQKVPTEWKQKLKIGGIIIYPKNQGIYKLVKDGIKKFREDYYPGFSFVPFI